MTNIHGIQPPAAPRPVQPTGAVPGADATVRPPDISDTVEISQVAKLAAKIQELPEVRTELVERVKAEIAAGTYETPQRIEVAVTRLTEELAPGTFS